jgi:hypothetical protein
MAGRITVVAGPHRRLLLAHDEVRSVDSGEAEDDESHLILEPRDRAQPAPVSDDGCWVWVQPDVVATFVAGPRPRILGHAQRFPTLARAAQGPWPNAGPAFVVRHGPVKLDHLREALGALPAGASLTVVLDPPHV